jgi:glucosamine-6-phosphate deaminase
MNLSVHREADGANAVAADDLANDLAGPSTRNVIVAGGRTPLDLYRRIARRNLPFHRLSIFALDEYVGVPLNEPRRCANLLRRTVVEAWNVQPSRFFTISSLEGEALASVQAHERRIAEAGGVDTAVLGLGKNGHLGFNEPGSSPDSLARVVDLEQETVEANRNWFTGDYAPSRGATLGLASILSARHVIVVAYGPHKAAAVKRMVEGPISERCPASFLRYHPATTLFLDEAAATTLEQKTRAESWIEVKSGFDG